MDIKELRIHSFLRLGYFIDYARREPLIDFSVVDRERYANVPRSELVRMGVQVLRDTFAEQFKSGEDIVVPLSGGLDSRMIVGALLELTEARNIQTVTYGIPGAYDYDIGCLVAKHAGTRHTAMAIDGFTYHEDELLDRARRMQRQVDVFFCPPLWAYDKLFHGAIVWSGYVNDAVGGSHLSKSPSPTRETARWHYLEKRRMVRSLALDRCPEDELVKYVAGGDLPPKVMSFDEQVLFEEAVYKFTAPVNLFNGFTYRTPFINTPWMGFMFSAPDRYRLGQKLMQDIARAAFPRLFALPTKKTYGRGLRASGGAVLAARIASKARKVAKRCVPALRYPLTQYNDFDERFRDSPDLMDLARRSLADLRTRGVVPWLDLDAIWRRHQARRGNHGDALIALVSLGILLKSAE